VLFPYVYPVMRCTAVRTYYYYYYYCVANLYFLFFTLERFFITQNNSRRRQCFSILRVTHIYIYSVVYNHLLFEKRFIITFRKFPSLWHNRTVGVSYRRETLHRTEQKTMSVRHLKGPIRPNKKIGNEKVTYIYIYMIVFLVSPPRISFGPKLFLFHNTIMIVLWLLRLWWPYSLTCLLKTINYMKKWTRNTTYNNP